MKKIIIIFLLFCLVGCSPSDLGGEKPKKQKLKTTKDKILNVKTVDWLVNEKDENGEDTGGYINRGKIKKYLYISEKKVATGTIVKNDNNYTEDVSKRGSNVQFFKADDDMLGGTNVIETEYIAKFYTGNPFYQDENGDWYETETATSTIEEYEEATATTTAEAILHFIGFKPAVAACGDSGGDCYSGAGDGAVINDYDTWDTVHDATTGDSVNYTSANMYTIYNRSISPNYRLYRSFFPVDTSALPDNATVTAADFKLYITVVTVGDNDGDDYLAVVETFQNSTSVLVVADTEDCGSDNGTAARAYQTPIEEGSSQIDMSTISTGVYTTFTLNATGRGWINKTGVTKIGMREGHDLLDHPLATNTYNRIAANMFESSGTATDPHLEITYTVSTFLGNGFSITDF